MSMSYEDLTYALDGAGDNTFAAILSGETNVQVRGILDGRPVLADVASMTVDKADNGDFCVYINIDTAKD